MTLLLASLAFAGPSPDRPGFGDSTGATPAGHASLEAGATISPGPPVRAAGPGAVVRVGILPSLEGRVGLPNFGLGGVLDSYTSLGAKVAAPIGDTGLAISAVPTIALGPPDASVTAHMSVNASYGAGPVGVWVSTIPSWSGQLNASVGGGVSLGPAKGGGLVNVGYAGESFVGVGGWFAPTQTVQIDATIDLYIGPSTSVPVASLGIVLFI
jgi:hypothetical protein